MMGEDDRMVLNLVSDSPKKRDHKVKSKTDQRRDKIKTFENDIYVHKKKVRDSKPALHKTKSEYIDPPDFVPVSSLFNKNPEIPTHTPASRESTDKGEKVFSSDNIDELPIAQRLKENLKNEFKFETLTNIQKHSIPNILEGNDLLIKSVTGSGKTMCYAVPIVDKLTKMQPPITRADGTYALILVPTRELGIQIYENFQLLCKSYISIVPGLLIGGEKCKSEKARLRKGVNIIISTPGRLEYHLKETKCLDVAKLFFLVLDEADKLLEMGYEKTVKNILNELNNRVSVNRQSLLLSATLNSNIQNLADVTLLEPLFIDAHHITNKADEPVDKCSYVVPSTLQQHFVIVPAKLRLVTLISFVYFNGLFKSGKVIIFCSNKKSVIFLLRIMDLLAVNYFKLPKETSKYMFALHGDMPQDERNENFKNFKLFNFAILFTTDVSARGLDIPTVNWIIQFSCPTLIEDYFHRVGRTARIGEEGQSLIFLLPSEVKYLSELEKKNIRMKEMKLNSILGESLSVKFNKASQTEEKATILQLFIEEEIILKSNDVIKIAVSAYHAYIKSYTTYPAPFKHIFHLKYLHLGHVAKSFGLRDAPKKIQKVNLSKKHSQRHSGNEKNYLKKRKHLNDENEIYSGPRTKKYKANKLVKQISKNKKKARFKR